LSGYCLALATGKRPGGEKKPLTGGHISPAGRNT
jgi:hypothetical protein